MTTMVMSENIRALLKMSPVLLIVLIVVTILVVVLLTRKPTPSANHYDFVEIGTSNFDTLIQEAGPTTRGLSVEAINFYLDQLPDKPLVTKVNWAISDTPGTLDVYYVDPADIDAYDLPAAWRGCNSIGAPHSQVLAGLTDLGLTHLIKTMSVKVHTYADLMRTYNVGSVEFLKTDTEGHDPVILSSVIEAGNINPAWFPRKIQFESNHLTSGEVVDEIIERLSFKYVVVSRGYDTVLERRD